MPDSMQESRDKAKELMSQNNLKEAVFVLEEAIKNAASDRDKSFGFCDIATCYYLTGNVEDAKLYYKVALQKDPKNELAWYNQAWLKFGEGCLEDAIHDYDKAIEILPSFLDAHVNKGLCYLKQNNTVDAKECYQKAAELRPDNYDIQRTLGVLCFISKEYYEAIAYFKKELQLQKSSEAYTRIARCFRELNEYEQALTAVQNALSIDAKFADAHEEHGDVLFEMKQYLNAALQYTTTYQISKDQTIINKINNAITNSKAFNRREKQEILESKKAQEQYVEFVREIIQKKIKDVQNE